MSGPAITETRSTCPYCGVGCGVLIATEAGRITGVRGDPDHPSNQGRLCSKGSQLHLTALEDLQQQARVAQPLRRPDRQSALQPTDWESAMGWASHSLSRIIQAHGPDAVGFYLSGQFLTEDYYVYNKLVKGLLGSNQLDTNSRLCMASAATGYKLTLGADAPPNCYDDLALADCLFISGSNTAWAHPVLFRRIEQAKADRPSLRTIVVDPRRTETAAFADLHLAIRPGTDVLLHQGLLKSMLDRGLTSPAFIAAHTEGFEAHAERVMALSLTEVAQTCGIRLEDLETAARWFAQGPTLSLYCQGLNQSSAGTANNISLIHLHLATGQIGRPGAGPFSLTGQPNAMGGREVGGMATLLSAHRDLANPDHRAEVARLWGIETVPEQPGRTAVEMFEAAADGEVKALWIGCTNPAQSMPHQSLVRQALQNAELVVVQEAFLSAETIAHADLVLPTTTWGEKSGTVTNSERRISRVRAARPPFGASRHDWQIGVDLAQRLSADLGLAASKPGLFMAYESTEQIWNEHRESTRGRDLDITGMSYALLDAAPRHWPMPESRSGQEQPRLYADGCFPTPSGRARFVDIVYAPIAEPADADFPLLLNTGRLRDHWHGMTRTGLAPRLFAHIPEPRLAVHPDDLLAHGLVSGDLVRLSSRRGELVVRVAASEQQQPGQVYLPMHWGQAHLSGRSRSGEPLLGVNALTNPAFCPRSKQPELKSAAVQMSRLQPRWSMLAMAWLPAAQVESIASALRANMGAFDYSCLSRFQHPEQERDRQGLMLRAASLDQPEMALLDQLVRALDLEAPELLRYQDRQRAQLRVLRLSRPGEQTLEAGLIAGETAAEAWLLPLLQQGQTVAGLGQRLLFPGAAPPLDVADAGRTVCSCLGVREPAIVQALAAQPSTGAPGQPDEALVLASLKASLGCGSQCGSCVPELRQIIARETMAAMSNPSRPITPSGQAA